MKVILLIDCCSGLVRGISPKCSKDLREFGGFCKCHTVSPDDLTSPPERKSAIKGLNFPHVSLKAGYLGFV